MSADKNSNKKCACLDRVRGLGRLGVCGGWVLGLWVEVLGFGFGVSGLGLGVVVGGSGFMAGVWDLGLGFGV